MPAVPSLLDSVRLPLLKPNGGIRPILIGEPWPRLACQCAVLKLNELGPVQHGVGLPGKSRSFIG